MARQSKDDLEFLVSLCSLQKLSTQESLRLLNEKGYTISERTFYKYKAKIQKYITEKISTTVENTLFQFLSMVNSQERIVKELWKLHDKTTDVKTKVKILDNISKHEAKLTDMYNNATAAIHTQRKAITILPLDDSLNFENIIKERIETLEFNAGRFLMNTYETQKHERDIKELKNKIKRYKSS